MNGITNSASESISESISGSLSAALQRRVKADRARRHGGHGYTVTVLGSDDVVAWAYDLRGALADARTLAGRHGLAHVHRVDADGTVGELVRTVRGPDVVADVTALPVACPVRDAAA